MKDTSTIVRLVKSRTTDGDQTRRKDLLDSSKAKK